MDFFADREGDMDCADATEFASESGVMGRGSSGEVRVGLRMTLPMRERTLFGSDEDLAEAIEFVSESTDGRRGLERRVDERRATLPMRGRKDFFIGIGEDEECTEAIELASESERGRAGVESTAEERKGRLNMLKGGGG
jgi:hypothetical protein